MFSARVLCGAELSGARRRHLTWLAHTKRPPVSAYFPGELPGTLKRRLSAIELMNCSSLQEASARCRQKERERRYSRTPSGYGPRRSRGLWTRAVTSQITETAPAAPPSRHGSLRQRPPHRRTTWKQALVS